MDSIFFKSVGWAKGEGHSNLMTIQWSHYKTYGTTCRRNSDLEQAGGKVDLKRKEFLVNISQNSRMIIF